MSRQIAQTVGGSWIILVLMAILCFAAALGMGIAVAQTPTPAPAPKLTYGKFAQVSGHEVTWTLFVENSGNSQSEEISIVDTLPAGADWFILDSDVKCDLGPSSFEGRSQLTCDDFIVEKRHLNEAEDDFENGSATVTVYGVVDKCGDYVNTAVFLTPLPVVRSATAPIACPATPTPSPTPSPTPVPSTPTPTMTPAASATTVAPTSTPTARNVPLPPNTGDSPSHPGGGVGGGDDSMWLFIILGLGSLTLAVSGITVARRAH